MKRISLLLLLCSAAFCSQAQLPTVFSQYFFNELVINPAYAGAHVQTSSTVTYRNQWINFPGSPKTFAFSTHSSFVKGKVGLGLLVNVDKIGSYTNSDITFVYSYKLKFPKSTLSFGIQGVLYFLNANYGDLLLIDPSDPSFASFSNFKPSVGAGVYYHKKNWFVGFSVPYIINNKFDADSTSVNRLRNYFLRSGFIHPISKDVKINPSFLLRAQEGTPLAIDLNLAFIFYDTFSTGLSYRSGQQYVSFVGIKLLDNLYFNYSFDFTGSSLYPYASGTHELMLNYRTKIGTVHKNLACPDFHSYREN